MNLFQDYFSDYVSDFQLSTLGAGVIRRFAVKRAERELTVVLALNELVDYSVFKSAEESIKKNKTCQISQTTTRNINSWLPFS